MMAHEISKKRNLAGENFTAALKEHRMHTTAAQQNAVFPSTEKSVEVLITQSIEKANNDPRFTGWSVKAKCAFAYLSATTPQFKASHLINEYVEAGLAADYPELWTKTVAALEEEQRRKR